MAERIMAGRPTPKSSRRASGSPPATPRGSDARDQLENVLTQLHSLLWCCYGHNGWFEEVGEKHRDNLLWIAADLAREAEELLQESVRE